MPTIKEVKKELRHKEWAEQIAECQSSGMSMRDWCQSNGINCNTYYRHLRTVRMEMFEKAGRPMQKIVPVSIAGKLCEPSAAPKSAVISQSAANPSGENIVMRKDGIEIELPQSTSEDAILALLKGLKQC